MGSISYSEGIDRGICLLNDGTVSGFRARKLFNRLGIRRGVLERTDVYCADGTIRRIEKYDRVRLAPPYPSVLFLNPFCTGEPVLSEPLRTYKFEDLRGEVRKRLVPAYQTTEARRHIKARVLGASTFDDLLEVVLRPTEGLEE